MIRIETEHQEGRVTIKVEGRLAGMFVPELEQCWREQTTGLISTVVVDLKLVLNIDADGSAPAPRDVRKRRDFPGRRYQYAE